MAFFTIEKRLRSDGTARYRCTVAVKKNGSMVTPVFATPILTTSWLA